LIISCNSSGWLDRASAAVLGLVARRLDGHQLGFLAASRSDGEGFFDRGGLPVHEVLPLSEAAATALVGSRFPALASQVRQRLLAEAQGNPLALLELPVATAREGYQIEVPLTSIARGDYLITVAAALTAGAGDLTLKFGAFTMGGIGTATFGAIIFYQILAWNSAEQ